MSYHANSPYSQRKRRTFGIGSAITTALAAYGTYHLALWAWNAWNATEDDENDGKKSTMCPSSCIRLRKRRMMRCQREIATTLTSLGKILQRKIEESTDLSLYRSQLKEIRKLQSHSTKHQEEVLWMKIQVETVSRLVTNAYAYTLLFIALTIQVHCMTGAMYKKQPNEDATEHEMNGQNALLLSYEAFLERGGIDDLLTCVRNAVVTALKDWSIQDPTALHMNAPRLQQAIHAIRIQMESENMLQHYFVLDKGEFIIDNVALLNEMYDLFESPVAKDATKECLNCVFTALEQHHMMQIFATESADVPLARVVTQLKATTNSFFTSTDTLISSMEALPSVQEAALISFGR